MPANIFSFIFFLSRSLVIPSAFAFFVVLGFSAFFLFFVFYVFRLTWEAAPLNRLIVN